MIEVKADQLFELKPRKKLLTSYAGWSAKFFTDTDQSIIFKATRNCRIHNPDEVVQVRLFSRDRLRPEYCDKMAEPIHLRWSQIIPLMVNEEIDLSKFG